MSGSTRVDGPCGHVATQTKDVDENANRRRTSIFCSTCQTWFHGCLAHRLDDEPDDNGNREAWGPVGVEQWWARPVTVPEGAAVSFEHPR